MTAHIRYLGSVTAAIVVMAAAGWAAAAQTSGRAAPAAQGTAGPSPLFSQSSDQPIKIQSTSLEVRDKDHYATFIGNVRVVQGDTTLRCKTLVVFYDQSTNTGATAKAGQSGTSNQQIKRLEAKGDVVIVQKDQTATGDSGVFEMKTNTATLIGNVVVTQNDNVVRGDKLIVDMTTGVSRVECNSSKCRVEGLFKPANQPAGQSGNSPGTGTKESKPSAPLKIN
jgi:lipopolysaccharide export system protein LptA